MGEPDDDIALELPRVEAEVAALEAEVEVRRGWVSEAAALSAALRQQRVRLKAWPWASEVRVAGLAGGLMLVIAGSFALDAELGAAATASAFAALMWEAVK
jgi:hypothetical protein